MDSFLIHLYLNLLNNINADNSKVTAFASIIGKSDIIIPYINQENTPVVNIINMYKEISFVLLDLQTFTA